MGRGSFGEPPLFLGQIANLPPAVGQVTNLSHSAQGNKEMRYLAFLLLSVQFPIALLAEEQDLRSSGTGSAPTTVDQIVQSTLAVMDGGMHAEHYRTLFNKIKPEDIDGLQTQRDDTIAVRAAWQAVVLSVPEGNVTGGLHPARSQLNRFLGFLEGRLRIKIPSWWTDAILDSQAYGIIVPNTAFRKPPHHEVGLDGLCASSNTAIKQEGSVLMLTVGDESTLIPKGSVERTDSSTEPRDISALMTPSRCYVAVHEDVGYPYSLTCIDRSTGKELWTSRVRATWSGFSNGFHQMRVTLTEQDSRVVVFGCALTGFHLEVFRASDGLALFRFSSSY